MISILLCSCKRSTSTATKLSSPSPPHLTHDFHPVLLLQTFKQRVHEALSARLVVRHQLESTHEMCARTLWRGVRPKHLRLAGIRTMKKNSVRVPPSCAGRTPRTSGCTVFPVPRRDPPDVIFTRMSVAMRAHVRQCGTSLPIDWHNDPPQDAHALLHISAARYYFAGRPPASRRGGTPCTSHPRPRIEVLTLPKLRPIVFCSSLHRRVGEHFAVEIGQDHIRHLLLTFRTPGAP